MGFTRTKQRELDSERRGQRSPPTETVNDTATFESPKTPAPDGRSGDSSAPICSASFPGVTLYNADCLKMLPIEADAVISDPPYGIAFQHSGGGKGKGEGRWLAKTCTIIGDDKPFDPAPWLEYPIVVLWGADHYAQRLPEGAWLVWDKLGGQQDFGDNFSDVEIGWVNKKSKSRIYRHLWKGLIRHGLHGKPRLHVSEKPVPLMAWCMDKAKVPVGATVLDPYMGSGTTAIACIRTGRKFIGVEQDPKHFATAVERIGRELQQGTFAMTPNIPSSATPQAGLEPRKRNGDTQ